MREAHMSDTQRQDELNHEAMLEESMDTQSADMVTTQGPTGKEIIADLQAKLSTATAQLAEKDKAILKIHKELGCELRDPNGTIWEHAAAVQKKLDAATTCLALIRDNAGLTLTALGGGKWCGEQADVTLKEIGGHE